MSNVVMQHLGDILKGKDGEVQTSTALEGIDVLGLYFSAHWCPPCRAFTPELGKKYTALKEAGKSVEMVFLSSDRDEAAFNDYHDSMPFLALPYSKRSAKEALSQHFEVSGIPTLVFVDAKTGKTITDEGRGAIGASTFIEDFPYEPKPVNDLGATVAGIESNPSLVVVMEASSAETQEEVTKLLETIAAEEFQKDESDQAIRRFFTGKGEGPVSRIRSGCGLPGLVVAHKHELVAAENNNRWCCDGCSKSGETRFTCKECDFDYCGPCHEKTANPLNDDAKAPAMVILDLRNEGATYHPQEGKKEVTLQNIKAFMAAFKAKELTGKKFGTY